MIVTFLFFLFLLLENLLLPALVGPRSFLIVPLFVFAIVVYGNNTKLRLTQAIVFLIITEMFSASGFGDMILPFLIVIALYWWTNSFLDIKLTLRESGVLASFLGGAFFLSLLAFLFSYAFLFLQLSYSFLEAWQMVIILIKTSVYQIGGWALAFVIIFKYVVFQKK